jgi:hypothetical protein
LQRLVALSFEFSTLTLEFVNSLLLSFGLLGITLALFVESFQLKAESSILIVFRLAT